ncbi:MAG TPA: hypothetical protein VHG93_22425 [Longimicrobium sp.]|nr:hypothetical protein [Longimicrobium sp.]
MAENRRQMEQAITDGFDRDLHPNHLAGQNLGPRTDEGHRAGRTAYDVRSIHRTLRDWPDDELKEIPLLPRGERLQQGGVYLNLREPDRGEIRATGDMSVGPEDCFVAKDQVPYPTWNRLRGIDDPERTGADSHRDR